MALWYVYVLFDYEGNPFYVGMGRGRRVHNHAEPFYIASERNHIKKVITERTIAALGALPSVIIREDLSRNEAGTIEIALIATIGRRDLGTGPLANMSDGGTGGDFGSAISRAKANWTMEQRLAASERTRTVVNRWWTSLSDEEKEEHRQKLRDVAETYRRSLLTDTNAREARIDSIRRGHARRTADQKNEATRKRLTVVTSEIRSESARAWHANMTEEQRAARGRNISRALTGRPFSGDRSKLSAARAAEWKNPDYRSRQMENRIKNPSARNTIWITNGTSNRRLRNDIPILDGWTRGRTR